MSFPTPTSRLHGADEQSTASFRVLTHYNEDRDEVTIRVDRAKGSSGRPLYETLILTAEEADALRIGLSNQLD